MSARTSKTACPNFTKFFVRVAQSSSDDIAIYHVLPVLWTFGRLLTPRGGECTRPPPALCSVMHCSRPQRLRGRTTARSDTGEVKNKFHYAIQLANQLASWFASWMALTSADCLVFLIKY